MNVSKTEKGYLELQNLPKDTQLKILKRAKQETRFWRYTSFCLSLVAGIGIIYGIDKFLFPLEAIGGGVVMGIIVGLTTGLYNSKILTPKIAKLVQDEAKEIHGLSKICD